MDDFFKVKRRPNGLLKITYLADVDNIISTLHFLFKVNSKCSATVQIASHFYFTT